MTAGVVSNDVLWYQSGGGGCEDVDSLCSDLVDAILPRIEYFFEQNLETTGGSVSVQLLLCLEKLSQESSYPDLIEQLKIRLQRHRHQLDKRTLLLFNYASL